MEAQGEAVRVADAELQPAVFRLVKGADELHVRRSQLPLAQQVIELLDAVGREQERRAASARLEALPDASRWARPALTVPAESASMSKVARQPPSASEPSKLTDATVAPPVPGRSTGRRSGVASVPRAVNAVGK